MVRAFFAKIAQFVSNFLHQPALVFAACLILVSFGLVLDGSLLRLWALHRDSQEMTEKLLQIEASSASLKRQIARAQDPQYIEQQARERFDLVGEKDLVFVFSDDETTTQVEKAKDQ